MFYNDGECFVTFRMHKSNKNQNSPPRNMSGRKRKKMPSCRILLSKTLLNSRTLRPIHQTTISVWSDATHVQRTRQRAVTVKSQLKHLTGVLQDWHENKPKLQAKTRLAKLTG